MYIIQYTILLYTICLYVIIWNIAFPSLIVCLLLYNSKIEIFNDIYTRSALRTRQNITCGSAGRKVELIANNFQDIFTKPTILHTSTTSLYRDILLGQTTLLLLWQPLHNCWDKQLHFYCDNPLNYRTISSPNDLVSGQSHFRTTSTLDTSFPDHFNSGLPQLWTHFDNQDPPKQTATRVSLIYTGCIMYNV